MTLKAATQPLQTIGSLECMDCHFLVWTTVVVKSVFFFGQATKEVRKARCFNLLLVSHQPNGCRMGLIA